MISGVFASASEKHRRTGGCGRGWRGKGRSDEKGEPRKNEEGKTPGDWAGRSKRPP